jgi:peptidoglycan hydrolase CwlO-like protein
MTRLASFLFIFVIVASAVFGAALHTHAETTIDALQAEIAGYQKQLTVLGTEKTTLQSTINSLSLQQKQLTANIKISQSKITAANSQIKNLTNSISDKEETIAENQNAIAKALRVVSQDEQNSLVTQFISSNSLQDAWRAADITLQFNKALTNNITKLRSLRTVLSRSRESVKTVKEDLISLQNDLNVQNKSVAQNKSQQQQLLAQTKNSEANFQKLLASAKAELAAFSAFTTAQGGAKLLSNQTACDTWGCYYSQRDSAWGNFRLNGTQYRLASDGCLVTSMAMVLTHYGYRDVTPVTINSNPDNFAAYYPAYMLFTTYVDGVTATRVKATIDATLSTGNPVIVGLHAYGGTHFVVLTEGSGGTYLMRDPYIANGKDILFTDHYKISNIYAIHKVVINS